MSKVARAILQLPPATVAALEKLGADLAVARLRRKESLRSWAKRLGVTVSTLQRLEAGDPSVGVGIVATARAPGSERGFGGGASGWSMADGLKRAVGAWAST